MFGLRKVKLTEKEKMIGGMMYIASDFELRADFLKAKRLIHVYNKTREHETDIRKTLLEQLLYKIGENIYIEPPFRCDYGYNITVGENFYANYDCIILDVSKVLIGNNVLFGPRVCIYTAGHPINAAPRNEGLEFGLPITIGDDVWLGGNVIVNPGITIGSNVVIGSGSVVTKDIPDNSLAVGNPCKVIRKINK